MSCKIAELAPRSKIVRRELGRDGKILSDHRQDGNDEVHRLSVRYIKKKKAWKRTKKLFSTKVELISWAAD